MKREREKGREGKERKGRRSKQGKGREKEGGGKEREGRGTGGVWEGERRKEREGGGRKIQVIFLISTDKFGQQWIDSQSWDGGGIASSSIIDGSIFGDVVIRVNSHGDNSWNHWDSYEEK